MPIEASTALIALGAAIVAVAVYHFTAVAPRLRTSANVALPAGSGEALTELRASLGDLQRSSEARLGALEDAVRSDLQRVGFVRYNSFSDVGSDLSYSFALVDGRGDGVVLTSIYSREETRSFGKAVRNFAPQQGASKEEQAAIEAARAARAQRA